MEGAKTRYQLYICALFMEKDYINTVLIFPYLNYAKQIDYK